MAATGSAESRRRQACQLNALIDRALRAGPRVPQDIVAQLGPIANPATLAERVRRRATRVGRRERKRVAEILRARDALIVAVYARAVPAGWSAGWCDGSTTSIAGRRRSAVGGLLFGRDGELVAVVQRPVGGLDAFTTEIEAVEAVLEVGLARGMTRLRVHTDCTALVLLWRTRRRDPRLCRLCVLARELSRLQLVAVPREHNQPAHRLAGKCVRFAYMMD